MRRSYFKNDALPLWRLAVPLVLTGLSQALMPFFETLFLARLGVWGATEQPTDLRASQPNFFSYQI